MLNWEVPRKKLPISRWCPSLAWKDWGSVWNIWAMEAVLQLRFELGTVWIQVRHIATSLTCRCRSFLLVLFCGPFTNFIFYRLGANLGSLQSSLGFLDMSIRILSELPISGSTLQDLSAFKDNILQIAKHSGGK